MRATPRKLLTVLIGSTFLCATVMSEAKARSSGVGIAAGIIGAGIIGMAIGSAMSRGHYQHRHYYEGRSYKKRTKKRSNEDSKSAHGDDPNLISEKGSAASVVQFALAATGLYDGPQTGKMNNETQLAVAQWQKSKNQPVTGRLTQAQFEELQKTIVVIQQLLAELGFDPGPSDGNVTPRFRESVQRYQTKLGVQATGFLDQKQANALVAMLQERTREAAMNKIFEKIANADNVAAPTRSANAGPQFGADPITPASFRTLCQNRTVSLTFVVAKDSDVSGNGADEFCDARADVMDEASTIFKLLSARTKNITTEVVRSECMRFAESKRADIAALQTETPEAIVARLGKDTPRNPQQNEIAIGNAKVCLGFGYAEDKPEMSLGSVLFLLGLGQTGYAELIAADFAVGAGVPKDLGRAVAWLGYAGAELDAGKPPAVKGLGAQRAKILRQVADRLQVAMQTVNAGLVGPSFAPKFSLMPQGADAAPGGSSQASSGAAKYVTALEENTVFIYTGDSSGTGFFIAPNLILTNDHVVRGYDRVLIASKAMPLKVQRGKVLYRGKTGREKDTGLDAAVIEVQGYQHPTVLKFAKTAPPVGGFTAVGGFPGLSLDFDRGYQDFKTVFAQGGLPSSEQLPHMTVSTGSVQSYFVDADTGRERMQQSAQSAKGNSGSPIVNACGQVVALLDSGSVQNLEKIRAQGYVQGTFYVWTFTAAEVTKFLNAVGVKYQTDDELCRTADAGVTVH